MRPAPCLLVCGIAAFTSPSHAVPPGTFVVRSSDIGADGHIAASTGCGPSSRTPALEWGPPPDGTETLAVIVSVRKDGVETVHWTAWDIDPASGALPAGIRPTTSPPLQGVTTAGSVGWRPLCDVPQGATVVIEVAALASLPPPPPTFGGAALRARLAPHLLALGRLEAALPSPPGARAAGEGAEP